MPVIVERLPNERIIIATLTGKITTEDVKQVYVESAQLMGDEAGTFYRITDTRGATSDFSEMLQAVQGATQGMPASTGDSKVRITFVGTTVWIDFWRNLFAKRGVQIGAFENFDDALTAVRMQILAEDSRNRTTA